MEESVRLRLPRGASSGVDIMQFYDNVAAAAGYDPEVMRYDCTKILVARNIQTRIFAVLDAQSTERHYTAMMWCLRGPKTDDALADDTVELQTGFFRDGDTPLSLRDTSDCRKVG